MSKLVPFNTPEQLAWDIFNLERSVSDSRAVSVSDASQEVGFRKNSAFLEVTELSLVARQSVNAMYFLASHNPNPPDDVYDYDLRFFKWLIGSNSNNLQHLKRALKETHQASISLPDDDDNAPWASTTLVTEVKIINGRISFELPRRVRKHLTDARSFTYLSLRITAGFTSKHALTLYERLQSIRYRGSPSDWYELEDVKKWLGCLGVKTYDEYKNFKRFVLDKAIDEINELSDLKVEFETRSTGGTRRVGQIRFRFQDNPNGKLVLKVERMAAMQSYWPMLKDFELPQTFLDELVNDSVTYTDERIQAAVEYTRWKIDAGEVEKAAPYLMKAIREGWRISPAQREIIERKRARQAAAQAAQAAPEAARRQSAERGNAEVEATASLAEQALAAFAQRSDEERAAAIREFGADMAYRTAMRAVIKRGQRVPEANEAVVMAHLPVRQAFGLFVAKALQAPQPELAQARA